MKSPVMEMGSTPAGQVAVIIGIAVVAVIACVNTFRKNALRRKQLWLSWTQEGFPARSRWS